MIEKIYCVDGSRCNIENEHRGESRSTAHSRARLSRSVPVRERRGCPPDASNQCRTSHPFRAARLASNPCLPPSCRTIDPFPFVAEFHCLSRPNPHSCQRLAADFTSTRRLEKPSSKSPCSITHIAHGPSQGRTSVWTTSLLGRRFTGDRLI